MAKATLLTKCLEYYLSLTLNCTFFAMSIINSNSKGLDL